MVSPIRMCPLTSRTLSPSPESAPCRAAAHEGAVAQDAFWVSQRPTRRGALVRHLERTVGCRPAPALPSGAVLCSILNTKLN